MYQRLDRLHGEIFRYVNEFTDLDAFTCHLISSVILLLFIYCYSIYSCLAENLYLLMLYILLYPFLIFISFFILIFLSFIFICVLVFLVLQLKLEMLFFMYKSYLYNIYFILFQLRFSGNIDF